MLKSKSLTLLELTISIVLVGLVILGVGSVSVFFVKQISNSLERYNIHSQVVYAMDDIRTRCLSAIDIQSAFDYSGEVKPDLEIYSEADIYNITPDEDSDNVWYKYYVDDQNRLILENKSTGDIDVLVEGRFNPTIEFEYTSGDSPNFITTEIIATSNKDETVVISREEGIRFWFIEVIG